jgi:hypothetical protein
MAAIKAELAGKGIAPTDENAVLYAMFPRETAALYQKKVAPASPAPQPAPVVLAASNGGARPAPAATRPARRFFITINNHRSEVLVEELA